MNTSSSFGGSGSGGWPARCVQAGSQHEVVHGEIAGPVVAIDVTASFLAPQVDVLAYTLGAPHLGPQLAVRAWMGMPKNMASSATQRAVLSSML